MHSWGDEGSDKEDDWEYDEEESDEDIQEDEEDEEGRDRYELSLSERIALYCLVLPCIASHKRVPLASLLTPRCVHTLNLTKYHIWEHPRL